MTKTEIFLALELIRNTIITSHVALNCSIRPRWQVRMMSAIAHGLWKCRLGAASWAIADLCIWLQTKIRSRNYGGGGTTGRRSPKEPIA